MNKTTKMPRIDDLDEGRWLKDSLTEEAKDVARHPTPEAIGRMRSRLMAQLKRPTKVAA